MTATAIKYKQTGLDWMPEVPEHWTKIRLKYITKYQRGKVPKEFSDDSNLFPYLAMDYLRGKADVIQYVEPNEELKFVDSDKILVLWDGANAGEILKSKKGYISSTMAVVEPDEKYFSKNFFYYFLKSLEKDLKMLSTGTTIPHLNQEYLFDSYFFTPPLPEQTAIVQYLKAQEEKINLFIQKKQRFIELLKEQRLSIVNNYVTSETESWIWLRLKDIVTVNDEALTEKTEDDYLIRYIDIGNVNLYGNIAEIQEYEFKDAPSRARRIVRKGDVIISTVRTYLKAITLIETDEENLIASTGFAVLRPKENVLSEYLNFALRAEYFISSVIQNSYGVSYPAINSSTLCSLKIVIPKSTSEQQEIINKIKTETATIDTAIAKAEREIELIREYKEAMIAEAVMGKRKLNFAQ